MLGINILIVLFLPLLAFLMQLFLPKKIDRAKVCMSSIIMLLSSFLCLDALIQIYQSSKLSLIDKLSFALTNSALSTIEFSWISLPALQINFGIILDSMSILMLLVVSFISLLVHIFSIEYMRGDKRFSRYYAYLGLFTFSMNGIVLSNNLFFTFIFWELVGVSSFLLIGFWYEKNSAGNAAKKAFLVNRVGDIGMFLGIMLIFFTCNSFNYKEITSVSLLLGSNSSITLAGLLIFMGAVGKSAQLPLHVWLPDAMEGPTPVSALIHAATMVAAGVYMTLRIFPFLTVSALNIIAIIGAITALTASLIATSQYDIKKILAYSTVSQLGYMICSIGVGAYFAAFFHLITHAMFKACLFLSSGSIIHSIHHSQDHIKDHSKDPQDIRNMGGLKNKLPITFIAMLISTLSLCGFPFFSGFLSKDSIVAGSIAYYHQFHGLSIIIPVFIIFSAFLTSFYMFRLIFLTFFGKPKDNSIYSHIEESSWLIKAPLVLLAFLSLANVFTFPNLNPFDLHGWFSAIIISPDIVLGYDMHLIKENIHHAHKEATIFSILVAILGFIVAFIRYYLNRDILGFFNSSLIQSIKEIFANKFYVDEMYDMIIISPYLKFSKKASILDWDYYDQKFIDFWGWLTLKLSKLFSVLDYSIIDQFIVDGFARFANKSGKELQSSQNGILQSYLISAIVGLVALIIIIQQLG
tara:strand:- start:547 stop:2625 length:2079 start_codon:yes stop_codon:yes gene_type:complete